MINETEYKTNGLGHKVPVDKIKPLDLIRDEVVLDLVKDMEELKRHNIETKITMKKKFNDFVELSFNESGIQKFGGKKGNITLTSFDGNYQVRKAIGEYKHFDERIQAAKALLDECVVEWSDGANENLKALVDHAFRVNKQGKIDVNQVLSLRQLDIDEPKWLQAMEAIADSIQVTGSAEYIRFYQKDSNGKYQQVNIDFSRI